MNTESKTYGEMTKEELVQVVEERNKTIKIFSLSEYDIKERNHNLMMIDKVKATIKQIKEKHKAELKSFLDYKKRYEKEVKKINKDEIRNNELRKNYENFTKFIIEMIEKKGSLKLQ